ncbi:hypothetical protein [Paenibacillus sp. KS-LC4]|uniref:hypothetical protein n=1 Tax=Paenibacillus sp. KS-LC4 TaxID=2979727 RepID=UPI0030CB932B
MKNYIAYQAETFILSKYTSRFLFGIAFLAVIAADFYFENYILFQFTYLMLSILVGLSFWKEAWIRGVLVVLIVFFRNAMTSKRVYRGELDVAFAIEEIQKNAGTQFDPDVVNAFLNIWQREGTRLLSKYSA